MNKSSHVWRKYLLSYLLVFAIPFFMLGFFIYMNTVKVVQHEIEQANHYKLQQVQTNMDEQIIALKQLATKMAVDQRLSPSIAQMDDYYAAETVKELIRYKENSVILADLLLYFRGDARIFSTQGAMSLDVLTQEVYRFPEEQRADFLHDLQNTRQIALKPAVPVMLQADREERYLTYMFPVLPYSSQPHATVLFLINEARLTAALQNMLGDVRGAVYLLNEAGEVLAVERSGGAPDVGALLAQLSEEQRQANITMDHVRYSVMRERSELTGWTYVIAMPTEQFWFRVMAYQTTAGAVLLLALVVGLSFAVFLSSKHANPIRELVTQIQQRMASRAQAQQPGNEIDWLRGAVDDMHTYTQRLESDIEQQRPLVMDQLLYRLLTGRVSVAEGMDEPELIASAYFVMVFSYRSDASSGSATYRLNDELYALLNRVKLAGHDGYGLELLEERAFAVVMVIRQPLSDPRADQEQAAAALQHMLNAHCQLSTLIGVGSICDHPTAINRSFIEGLATIAYRLQYSEGHVLFFEDIAHRKDQHRPYAMGEHVKFMQSLRMADRRVCLDSLQALFDDIARMEQSVLLLRYMCFDIVNAVLKELQTLKLGLDWPETQQMMAFQTLDELRDNMQIIVMRICDHVEAARSTQRAGLCEQIVAEIEQHYRSDQFSLEMLAQQFQVSASYLSRLIKEQTGTTFTEYIQQLRLQAVKAQLVSSTRPIKEIIQEVGYQDMSSFIRRFRKMEGLTPGEYRRQAGRE